MATETLQLDPPAVHDAHASCTHCGLPVPAGLVESDAERQFCCHGCRAAYGVISSCGLSDYYALLQRSGDHGSRSSLAEQAFAEFDDPAFAALYVQPVDPRSPAGPARLDLVLEGMHCAACVWLLERLPQVVSGVRSATVMLGRSTVSVVFDPGVARPSQIAGAVATLGYTPHPPRGLEARNAQRAAERRQLIRIAVAGACTGNVMILAFALYGGVFGGSMSAGIEALFRWLSLAVTAVSFAWPAREFFRNAWVSLRTRTPSIDAPIVLALVAGGVMGLVNTVLNRGEIYFDSLTMLVFLLLVGRFFGQRQQRAAADSVELLFCLTSGAASRVEADGAVRRVPIESLAVGDLVEVRPGESLPADGVVEQGESSVDQALLTGESRPVAVGRGSQVLAGTVNAAGVLRVRVGQTGRQTRAGRLMDLVERCAARRPAIVRFADSIARPFTVAVALASAAIFTAWSFIDPAHAVDHAVSFLIVTCPCALGVAAPLAVFAAIGRGARAGTLVKDGDVLERLARPGLILLDKTGTLTLGRVRVVRQAGDTGAMELAAAVERHATHPIARAVAEAFDAGFDASHVEQTARGGILGRVNGRAVAIGNEGFVSRIAPEPLGQDLAAAIESARADALTPLLVAVDGRVRAVITVGDGLREDAAESVSRLRQAGWRVGILSGDEPAIVASLAQRLGLDPADCRGGVSPEDKAAIVRDQMAHGPVVMAGDGVNDAAALATATVGIAVHGGAEASMAAADAYLARPGLAPVVELVNAGPRMLRAVKRIFAVSLAYNVLAGTLAAVGVIHPVVAAILMPISSLSVTAVALRSRTFELTRTPGARSDRWK